MTDRTEIAFTVNGAHTNVSVEPRTLLADCLRQQLGLTGTHLGCEHGVCGACTVRVNGDIVRSCLMFAVQADGAEVETVEGLSQGGELHPVQKAFRDQHGLQCGFCTPGFVVAVADFLEHNPEPTEAEIREHLSGNICRCTGYVHIVRAVHQAAEELRNRSPARPTA